MNETLIVGRDPANNVCVDDGYLSRQHCEIIRRASRVVIRDLGSYNGTHVNGQKIHEECYILPGDVLKVGRTRVFVDFGDIANQSSSLKIYSPDLGHRKGVEPVIQAKSPELTEAYRALSGQIPHHDPTVESSFGGPSTRAQTRKISPHDKTPIPMAAIEDSAVRREIQTINSLAHDTLVAAHEPNTLITRTANGVAL